MLNSKRNKIVNNINNIVKALLKKLILLFHLEFTALSNFIDAVSNNLLKLFINESTSIIIHKNNNILLSMNFTVEIN